MASSNIGVAQWWHLFESMLKRANELNLRLTVPEEQAKMDFLVLLTVQTMNYLHSGRHRVAL